MLVFVWVLYAQLKGQTNLYMLCVCVPSRFSQFTKAGGDAYLFDMSPIKVPDTERKLVIMVGSLGLNHPSKHSAITEKLARSGMLVLYYAAFWVIFKQIGNGHGGLCASPNPKSSFTVWT